MITIELNEDEVAAVLDRLSKALIDMTPVMEEIGDLLVNSTKERFKESVAPDGTKWAQKSQTTIAAYRRRGDRIDFRPLFGPTGRLSSEISRTATDHSVEIGSNLIYAAVMQFGAAKGAFGTTRKGGAIPWGRIPERPFLGISEQDRTNIVATVDEWLNRVAAAQG